MNPGFPALAFAALLAGLVPAQAQSVEEFYRGKSITLAIGFTPGGGYDLYARHLARHMSKYIPGRPTIVPQNMAGAGSLRAANFIYSAAPKDGTAFGTFARTTGLNPLLESGATFDGTKFTWLGSVTNDISLCVTWHTSKANTWENFLKHPTNLGGQAPSSEPDIFANLYKNVFGAPIKLVPGYPGTNEITLAMERSEVDGLCGLSWSTIQTRHLQWLKEKKINLLVQASFKKDPEIGRCATGHGADQGHREAPDSQAHPRGAGNGAAVRSAARHSARPRRRPDRRLRRHHEGRRVSRRRQEVADRRQSRDRPGHRQAARRALCHAQGCDPEGQPGDREVGHPWLR
jgi:hypothetical protein